MTRRVAIASDHAGFALKTLLMVELEGLGHEVQDLGTHGPASVDYPDFAERVVRAIEAGTSECGVLICGTGIGMSMAANRSRSVRAAVCHDVSSARLARQHNDASVLCLGARLVGEEVAKDCLRVFLETAYEGGRHVRRVAKLS